MTKAIVSRRTKFYAKRGLTTRNDARHAATPLISRIDNHRTISYILTIDKALTLYLKQLLRGDPRASQTAFKCVKLMRGAVPLLESQWEQVNKDELMGDLITIYAMGSSDVAADYMRMVRRNQWPA